MQFADSVEQEVAALKLYLEEVPVFLHERTATAAGAGDTMARDAYRMTQTFALEGGIHLLKLNTLPGWDQVDKIRRHANAVKHRLGLTFAQGTEAPLTVTDDVNVTPAELLERLMGARVWLLDIDKASLLSWRGSYAAADAQSR